MCCYICGGMLQYLGRLGKLVWTRCQDCGIENSIDEDNFDADEVIY